MRINNSVRRMFAALGVTAGMMMGQTALPVKTLYSGSSASGRNAVFQKLAAAGFQEIAFSSTGAEMGSLVDVNNPTKEAMDAKRTTNQAAAAYVGVVRNGYSPTVAPVPALNQAADAESRYKFKDAGDAAQAWATMRPNGMPYLSVVAWGGSKANSAASWKASLTVPGANQHLYAYMMLPAVQISGNLEAQGAARFQSRFVADLQINGHPAWNSEAVRSSRLKNSDQTPQKCDNTVDIYDQKVYLTQFGDAMNSNSWALEAPSPVKYVVLDLGVFPAGQKVDLTFLARLQAVNSQACCGDPGAYFCTRGDATLQWNDEATPVRLWFGPAIP